MAAMDQSADVAWRDGVIPVSTRFDDPYFSLNNGLAETRHVFLAGNDLPARLRDGFEVAELGFGTGLNLLALAALWRDMGAPGVIRFTSFEAFPMTADEMGRALTAFPELADLAAASVAQWGVGRRIELPGVVAEVIVGDARYTLPRWQGRADAWFLDGFSPAKNPELWSGDLMTEIARHAAPGGTFATYTAAGHVRRSLAAAGFAVSRVPGHAGKRHMSRGEMPLAEGAE